MIAQFAKALGFGLYATCLGQIIVNNKNKNSLSSAIYYNADDLNTLMACHEHFQKELPVPQQKQQ
jgi:hypothetical protein